MNMVKNRKWVLLSVSLFSLAFLASCATSAYADDPLKTVDELELGRYLGGWYEIARYQHGFEKNLVGAKAEYSLRDDGRIQVVNSGFKNT
ncbi:MAG: lipocalin family protein, partial [Sphaerochaeta sp.]|nr:lipocalin family protein [Sphaerochaeta sp.]